jgi:hypothetical protein
MAMTSTELVQESPAECALRFERKAFAYTNDYE